MLMERRTFLRSSCNACLLLATGMIMPALSGCGPGAYQVFQSEVKNDRVDVPADAFAKGPLVLVRPKGWYYSIALRKKDDGSYSALLLKCTHQDNQLTAASDGYSCSLHGSAFNRDGVVVKGPAERTLHTYPVTVENNFILINTKA
jgi:nitrite reductase/ring-hydroxylating ferredoxin subunit